MSKNNMTQDFSRSAHFPATLTPAIIENLQADHLLAVLKSIKKFVAEADSQNRRSKDWQDLIKVGAELETTRGADLSREGRVSYLKISSEVVYSVDDAKTVLELRADKPVVDGRDGDGMGLYVADEGGKFHMNKEPLIHMEVSQTALTNDQLGVVLALVAGRVNSLLGPQAAIKRLREAAPASM